MENITTLIPLAFAVMHFMIGVSSNKHETSVKSLLIAIFFMLGVIVVTIIRMGINN